MVAFKMVGLDPEDIPHVFEVSKRQPGPENLDQVQIVGDGFCEMKFKLPSTFLNRISNFAGSFYPAISPSVSVIESRCTSCGECVGACPASAIATGRVVHIDQSKCIKCYVCNEVCKYGAIRVRQSLSRILR
jgi:ferredoxin